MNRKKIQELRQIVVLADALLTHLECEADLNEPDEPETKYPHFPVPAEELRKTVPEHLRKYIPDGLYCLTLPELHSLGYPIPAAPMSAKA